MNLLAVLFHEYGDYKWTLKGNKYSDLVWEDKKKPKPSEEEVNNCISRLSEYKNVKDDLKDVKKLLTDINKK
jgi:hypothetical protein